MLCRCMMVKKIEKIDAQDAGVMEEAKAETETEVKTEEVQEAVTEQ